MGNPQWVDEIVLPQSKQENVVLEEACMAHMVNKEGKEKKNNKEKLALG